MQRTNCVNCGAAIDVDISKCPFCGTSYFDLTSIDFTENKPVAFKIKFNLGNKNVVLTQLAIPELMSVNQECNSVDMFACGHRISHLVNSRRLTTEVAFHAVTQSSNNNMLYSIQEENT